MRQPSHCTRVTPHLEGPNSKELGEHVAAHSLPHTPYLDTRCALYARPLSHSTSHRWICPNSGASDQQGLRNRADGIGLLIYSACPRFTRAARCGWVFCGYSGKAAVRSTGHAGAARSRGQPMVLIRPSASDAGCQRCCSPLRLSTVWSRLPCRVLSQGCSGFHIQILCGI